ncbi:ABC transporter substrate-binding protein [Microlunatus sp. GCM10028923]|uniref:ABC transporter substrate-binding protein n=1 Tax=Microlunatus sp. GCM10028923 TaxID=3273400 RepID=UPI0036162905
MTNPQLSRRTLLGLAGGMAATLLSGCGSGDSDGATGVINFWSYYEAAERGATFGDLAKRYEAANAGVTINLNLAPQNFNTVLRTAMMSDDRPEFLGITQYNMRDFAAAGLLADVGTVLDDAGIRDDIFPAAIEAGTVDGTLYGISDALRFGMWFYNPKGFDDLGIEPPKTYDDLAEAAGRIRAKKRYPILFGLKEVNTAANSFQAFVPTFIGLTEMIKASAARDYTGQPFVDALTMYRTMVEDGILDPADTGMAAADTQAMLATGEAVMLPSASYQIGSLIKLDPEISAFDEPVKLIDDPVATYWGGAGQMYCLTADSAVEEAARKLLTWWVSPEQLTVQVEKSGLVSSLRSANEKIPAGGLAEFAAARLDQVDPEGLFYNNYIPPGEAEAWGRAIQEVVSGAKTPEQAIETTVQAGFKG